MDYVKLHNNIINRAKNRELNCYNELHHILPKCLGGSNKKINLVRLTAKEHWLIHLILIEIYPDNKNIKLAVNMMMRKSDNQKRQIISSGKQFERLKIVVAKAHSELMKGKKRIFTEEHKKNISKSRMGIPSPRKGAKLSEETKRKVGLASKGRNTGDKNHMRRPELREWMRNNNPMKNKETLEKFMGDKNPNSKKVMYKITNKIYTTINSCKDDLKISRKKFDGMVKRGEIIYL